MMAQQGQGRRSRGATPRAYERKYGGWLLVIIAVVATVGILVTLGIIWLHHHAKEAQVANQPVSQASDAQVHSLISSGITRTYRVYTPAGVTTPAPLVVMLHGGGGSGANAEKYYGWDQQADKAKFIVAYPDGLGPNIPAWNVDGGNCCGYPMRQHISDVQFISDMVADIEAQAAIDKTRIYAAGISNGGIMAYTLACETNIFAAIGPDSATQLATCTHPSPTSVIHIHGLKDTTIPFDGSNSQGPGKIDGPPVTEVIDKWRQIDTCGAPSSTITGVVTTQISSCADGRAVELMTIADGGHGWPGSPAKSTHITSGGDAPSQALDATSVMWAFFAKHSKHE